MTPATAGKGGAVRVSLTRSEPVATTPERKVDQAAAQLYKDTPGAVVGVIKGGKLTFVKAYGAADLTYGMPFTPETPTNIGSSSKQFTGFALVLLASRGKLSLDDDVRKHIPELKDFGKKITCDICSRTRPAIASSSTRCSSRDVRCWRATTSPRTKSSR